MASGQEPISVWSARDPRERPLAALSPRNHSPRRNRPMNADTRKRPARTTARRLSAAALVALIASGSIAGAAQAATPAPLPGAVWMTDKAGSHLNENIYSAKSEVWL